jgi:hypothetical protein
MRTLLQQHYGFDRPSAFDVLLDAQATTAAIRAGLGRLVAGAKPGDLLVFHYSGHGSQVPDRDGDETADGLDEILCPYDLDWRHPIKDDDLYAVVRALPEGVTLAVVLDCCHSGTGLREPGQERSRPRCIPSPVPRRLAASLAVRRIGRRAAQAGAVLIAGCRDDQSSADAYIAGAYHGALTYHACLAVAESNYHLSYSRLVRTVRAKLRAAGFEQDPQLEGPPALLQAPAFEAALTRDATRPSPPTLDHPGLRLGLPAPDSDS